MPMAKVRDSWTERCGFGAVQTMCGQHIEVAHLQKKMCLRTYASAISIVSVLWCGVASASGEARSTPSMLADQQLQEKITDALESDRYFYSAHVNVSVRNGVIVLHGFVFSDWDLRDAIKIANRAAAGNLVVDDLAIEVGGRR
jgi:osmotically-inducible protein OsmY